MTNPFIQDNNPYRNKTVQDDNPYRNKSIQEDIPSIKPDVTRVNTFQKAETEPGFLFRFMDLASNASALINPMDPNPARSKLLFNIAQANAEGQLGKSLAIAGDKLKNTFTTEKGIKDLTLDTYQAVKNATTHVVDDPTGAIMSLPSGLLSIANAPIETLTGVDLTTPDGRILTEEERVQSIKDSAALVVQLLLTKGIGTVTKTLGAAETAPLTLKAAEALPIEKISSLASTIIKEPTKLGNFAQKAGDILKGTAIGAGSGASFGFISGAGDPNQIEKIVSNAVMFAPIGALAGVINTVIVKPKINVEAADVQLAKNIQAKRALDFKLNDTIKDLDIKASSIVTADNLADAVMQAKIKQAKVFLTIVEGVTESKLKDLPESLPYNIISRNINKTTGTSDVLLIPKDVKINPASFLTSGYLEGEVVSYNGKYYRINSTTPTNVFIKEGNDNIAIPLDQVRRVNQNITYDPQKLLDQEYDQMVSNVTGKLTLYKEDKAAFNAKYDVINKELEKITGKIKLPNAEERIKQLEIKKAQRAELENKRTELRKSIGLDKISYDDVVNAFQDLPLNKQLYFKIRLRNDVMHDAIGIKYLEKELLHEFTIQATAPKTIGTMEEFINHAQTNGYAIDISDAGKVILRDMNDPKRGIISEGKNIAEATKFINKSGQVPGIELVGPFMDAGTIQNLGEPVNVNRPEPIPFLQSPKLWTEQKLDKIDKWLINASNVTDFTMHWATPANNIFKAMDNKYGTRLHSLFFDQNQINKQQSLSNSSPYIDILRKINKKAIGTYKFNLKDFEHVMYYIESASPETLAKNMSPIEQGIAKLLNNNESISNAFKVRSWQRNNLKPKPGEWETFIKETGITPKDLKTNDILTKLFKMDPDEVNGGLVVRLARAINDKSVDRAQYAKDNNLTQNHIDIANQLEKLTNELAGVFNINKNDRLNYWMTHARLYAAGDLQATLDLFARNKTPEAKGFYSEQARTGEIDAYEKNPVVALYRYIKAGFDAKHFNPTEALSKEYLENVLSSNLIPPAERYKVRSIAESYLNDLRGRTPAMSAATEEAAQHVLSSLGVEVGLRKAITESLKVVQVGTQGFKPGAGVRDFFNATGFIYYRYGPEVLNQVLKKGLEETKNGNQLIKQGKLIGLTFDRLVNPSATEGAGSLVKTKLANKWESFDEISMKASGQDFVYNLIRQGMYQHIYDIVGEATKKLTNGSINKETFYKQIDLNNNYSAGIVKEVKRQIEQTSPVRYDKVAEYLARESARHVTPSYGLGNNPSGWGRNIGRLVGQYGSYSTWALHALKEPLTQGTYQDRLIKATRFGIYTSAIMTANNITGYNFSPWYIHRVGFMGGPLAQTGANMYNAMFGSGYEADQAKDKLKRLLPYNNEQFHRQFYIPGSFAIGDISQSIEEGNPLPFLGIKPNK